MGALYASHYLWVIFGFQVFGARTDLPLLIHLPISCFGFQNWPPFFASAG